MAELGINKSGPYGEVAIPAHAVCGWLTSVQRPLQPHRVESEHGQYLWSNEDLLPSKTFVWVTQGDRQRWPRLKGSLFYSQVQHAAEMWRWEPVPELLTIVHQAPSVTNFDQFGDDVAVARSRPSLAVAAKPACTLHEAQEHVHHDHLRVAPSVLREIGEVYRVLSPRFVSQPIRYSQGDLHVRECADLLASAGLEALAERVVELDDLVREEGDHLDLRSLRLASDFLVEHREFGPPQLSVTPRGEIQMLWRNTLEGVLIVMDFLNNASIRYAALATDRHPALHSDSTRGLAPASRVMDELEPFLKDLGRK